MDTERVDPRVALAGLLAQMAFMTFWLAGWCGIASVFVYLVASIGGAMSIVGGAGLMLWVLPGFWTGVAILHEVADAAAKLRRVTLQQDHDGFEVELASARILLPAAIWALLLRAWSVLVMPCAAVAGVWANPTAGGAAYALVMWGVAALSTWLAVHQLRVVLDRGPVHLEVRNGHLRLTHGETYEWDLAAVIGEVATPHVVARLSDAQSLILHTEHGERVTLPYGTDESWPEVLELLDTARLDRPALQPEVPPELARMRSATREPQ